MPLPMKTRMVSAADALPGRERAMPLEGMHYISGRSLLPPYPQGLAIAEFALGCFWGAERLFWELPGVYVTAAGYAGGYTPNPNYDEVCSGLTGHAEAVRVVFDPGVVTYEDLLRVFWEAHDPTQGMRQGNDVGTQYRSVIFVRDEAQRVAAKRSVATYSKALVAAGRGAVTTEIRDAATFYFAEDYHQQYLAKNPGGYCGLKGTGVVCPAVRPDRSGAI